MTTTTWTLPFALVTFLCDQLSTWPERLSSFRISIIIYIAMSISMGEHVLMRC